MQQKILILKNPHRKVIEDERARSLVIWKTKVKRRTEVAEAEVGEEQKEKERTEKKSVAEVAVVAEMQKMGVTNHAVAEVNIEGKMVKKETSLAEVVVDTVKMERKVISLGVAEASTEVKEKKVTSQDVAVAKLGERERKGIRKLAQEANLEAEMT